MNEKQFQRELIDEFLKRFNLWNEERFNDKLLNQSFSEKFLKKFLIKKYKNIENEEIDEIIKYIKIETKHLEPFKNNKFVFFNIINNGIATNRSKKEKLPNYKLIDLENEENNIFVISEEVKTSLNDRQDLVLFINGLPVINFELKSISINNKNTLVKKAIGQIYTYSKNSPSFFSFNIFSVALNSFNHSFVGSYTSCDIEHYFKILNDEEQDLEKFFNFFRFKNIVRYLKYGIFFKKHQNIKIILKKHQIEAVTEMIKKLKKRENGYIWHTQGSGKTITIISFCSFVSQVKDFASSSIILDVDRIDLIEQLEMRIKSFDLKHFSNTEIKTFTSSKELRKVLKNVNYKGIFLTTIQKFNKFLNLSKRDDLILISDEAHRTHNDKKQSISKKTYFENLEESLPNAIKFGFTGTPIFEGEKKTFNYFGKCIHKYTMRQAQRDGVIVDIKYTQIFNKIDIKKDAYKKEIYYKTKEIPKKIIGIIPDRVKKISKMILDFYVQNNNLFKNETNLNKNIKAMLVVNSIESGFKYLKELKKIFKNDFRINDKNFENKIELIVSKPQIDKSIYETYTYLKNVDNKKVTDNFREYDSKYNILIVCDKLLTGYDVPDLRMMFFDKNMEKHNLFQAICRVNRNFKNKEYGTIISFIDLKKNLKETLENYEGTLNEKANIEISESYEDKIVELLKKIKKKYEIDFWKLSKLSKYQNISFKINEIILSNKYQNDETLKKYLKEIKSISSNIYWTDKNPNKDACYLSILFLSILNKNDYEKTLLTLNSNELKEILNDIYLDKEIFIYIDKKSIFDLIDITEDNLSYQKFLDLINIKVIKQIKKSIKISEKQKKILLEKLKKIIEKYNFLNYYEKTKFKKDIEVIVNELEKDKYPQMIYVLTSIIEDFLNCDISNDIKKELNTFCKKVFNYDWWETEKSIIKIKKDFGKFLKKEFNEYKDDQVFDVVNKFVDIIKLKKMKY